MTSIVNKTASLAIGIALGVSIFGHSANYALDQEKAHEINTLSDVLRENGIQKEGLNENELCQWVRESADGTVTFYSEDEWNPNYRRDDDYVDIGIDCSLFEDEEALEIISVVKDSPAEKAGLLVGDVILSVVIDGQNLSASAVLPNIVWDEGQLMKLVVERQGQILTVTTTPQIIEPQNVSGRMVSDDTGVIALESMNYKAMEQFDQTLAELEAKGMKNLILDFRETGTRDAEGLEHISEKLFTKGVQVYGIKSGETFRTYITLKGTKQPYKLAVILGESSSGEVLAFANAVKTLKLGRVVGNQASYDNAQSERIVPVDEPKGYLGIAERYMLGEEDSGWSILGTDCVVTNDSLADGYVSNCYLDYKNVELREDTPIDNMYRFYLLDDIRMRAFYLGYLNERLGDGEDLSKRNKTIYAVLQQKGYLDNGAMTYNTLKRLDDEFSAKYKQGYEGIDSFIFEALRMFENQ